MEMETTVPWVSASKSKYFVNVSTKEECDFFCLFFKLLQSHNKLIET